jgi:hypothetical protein
VVAKVKPESKPSMDISFSYPPGALDEPGLGAIS